MLLLYRHLGKKSAVVFQPLHSTMLLLYRHRIDVIPYQIHALHSTMLLLYLRRIQHRRKLLLPLHSTMLLLYPGILDLLLPLCYIFTFHYASTISDWRHNPFAPQQLLYIPLCFYYISSYRQ